MRLESQDHLLAKQLNDQVVLPHLDELIEDFYDYMLGEEQILRFIGGLDINRLKKTQRNYLETLGQEFDSEFYFEKRLQIGLVHSMINLPLTLYQCSYFYMQDLLLRRIYQTKGLDARQRSDLYELTLKIVCLDMSLATDTYFSTNVESLEKSVSSLRDEKEKLSTKVNVDTLTGISSRGHILIKAGKAMAEFQKSGQPFSLVVSDIDYFKAVNDTYGHATGDAVLKNVAARMDNIVRGDDMVGRIGGEEFLIILPGSALETASSIAERVRESIEIWPIKFQDHVIDITMSFGVAESVSDENLEQLINRADQALYEAKRSGRNRVSLSEFASSAID
jgi:diguanylate cyclase (GGDEF)-like protein